MATDAELEATDQRTGRKKRVRFWHDGDRMFIQIHGLKTTPPVADYVGWRRERPVDKRRAPSDGRTLEPLPEREVCKTPIFKDLDQPQSEETFQVPDIFLRGLRFNGHETEQAMRCFLDVARDFTETQERKRNSFRGVTS